MAKFSSIDRRKCEATLSSELKKKYNVHSMPIRKGDTVSILRGVFRDVEGKVTQVEKNIASIYVEGVTKEKSDGSTIFMPIHSSKVMITKINLDDKWRKDILERRTTTPVIEIAKPKTQSRKKSIKKRIQHKKE